MPPGRRRRAHARLDVDLGEEMAAMAWSYAAALHVGINPALVFHDAGYHGSAQTYLGNFAHGRYVALPLLQWMGLAVDDANGRTRGIEPFPKMLAWLNDGSVYSDDLRPSEGAPE
jgi:hypothetical protein